MTGANCDGVSLTGPNITFTTCQGLWVRWRSERERGRRGEGEGEERGVKQRLLFVEMTGMSYGNTNWLTLIC